jgi:hypothetical protein
MRIKSSAADSLATSMDAPGAVALTFSAARFALALEANHSPCV